MPRVPSTPGPWFAFGNGHCVGGPLPPAADGTPQTAGVAMCSMRVRSEAECAANATLIVAAPLLLAACKLAGSRMAALKGGADGARSHANMTAAIDACLAAVAAAEGY